ncbi:FUSC family protein [Floricoccus penangensis]|uniref:FUSC family protein n=1 Tax=Floricoccus penangensis TaxID=1859475 RepID=UPI0009F4E604|nr:aromatic acid exporter family protein [Floricoccus penangensis]
MSIQIGRFRLGLRTIKTAIAMALILIFCQITNRPEGAMAAGVSAVVAVRGDFKSTVNVAGSRFIGAGLGGLLSIIFYLLYSDSGHNFWVKLFVIPISLMIIIVIMDGYNLNTGLVGACASFLIISLGTPEGETILYVFNRVLDTFIGVGFAIVVNLVGTHDTPVKMVTEKVIKIGKDFNIEIDVAKKVDEDNQDKDINKVSENKGKDSAETSTKEKEQK